MTPSQRQALEDVERHNDPWNRVRGQSQHGGWHSVMRVLTRKLWVVYRGKWKITAAGRAALKEEKR